MTTTNKSRGPGGCLRTDQGLSLVASMRAGTAERCAEIGILEQIRVGLAAWMRP